MSEYFIDYEKVLADLESKRDALNDAINGIRKLLHVNAQMLPDGTIKPTVNQLTGAQEIASDTFFGLSIRDAIKKYLSMMRKPQPYRVIADALEEGGFQHSSKKFHNTVNTTLNRLSEGDEAEIVKIRGEWGLAEWYPGMKRAKAASRRDDEGARQSEAVDEEEADTDESTGVPVEVSPEQPSLPTESEQLSSQSQTAS
jgi:hypothetical protein